MNKCYIRKYRRFFHNIVAIATFLERSEKEGQIIYLHQYISITSQNLVKMDLVKTKKTLAECIARSAGRPGDKLFQHQAYLLVGFSYIFQLSITDN